MGRAIPGDLPSAGWASMAYDPATANTVLFGGYGDSELSDTWTWNGTTWTERFPATIPPARDAASMAYDPATGEMVLFGGIRGESDMADTWVWNGTTWMQRSPANSPSARDGSSVAFDPGTGNLELFGGYDGNVLSDTWAYASVLPDVRVTYSCVVSGFGSTTIHSIVSESPGPRRTSMPAGPSRQPQWYG